MKRTCIFLFSLIVLVSCNETQPPSQEAAESETLVAEQAVETQNLHIIEYNKSL
mgnify:FL=1